MPAFFGERGLSASEIGIVLTAGTIIRLTFGPLLGNAADRFGAARTLALLAGCSGAVGMAYLAANGFWTLLAICMLHSIVVTPLSAISDALALASSTKERVFAYGWIRGLGSAAFVVGTLISGALVASYGTASIIVVSSVLFALMVIPVMRVPSAVPSTREVVAGGIATLLAIPLFRKVLVVGGLVIGSHAMSDTFAVIRWRGAGLGDGLIGALWSEAVASEILVFFVLGPRALRSVGPAGCAALGALAGMIRWATLATTSSVFALASTQLLHGLTFALVHLACLQSISEVCPPRLSATAQSIYGTCALGLSSAIFTTLSGFLYQRQGAAAFWLMAFVCLCALPVTYRMRRTGHSPVSASP